MQLGLRENAAQFVLLVAITAFVGAMVGLERSTLPLVGRDDFGLSSNVAVLSFIVAFGLSKSLTNLAAGALVERVGRRRLLILGWLLALPVPLLIALAPSWAFIVAANVALGLNQGLTWSMAVVMKVDLVGPRRRGLALGLNEAAGYLGVAVAATASGLLAAEFAARDVLVVAGFVVAVTALASRSSSRGTRPVMSRSSRSARATRRRPTTRSGSGFRRRHLSRPALRSCSQAGLVNNLNDGVAWGVVPLFLAANGASVSAIGLVAGLYPGVWGLPNRYRGLVGSSGPKALDRRGDAAPGGGACGTCRFGRRFLVAAMAAVALGAGTALVYPTLIAAISDQVAPIARAPRSASTASGATWAT